MATEKKTEYKGQMRLPIPVYEQLTEISALTGNSLNSIIIEAAELVCMMALLHDIGNVPLPRCVVLARAAAEHKRSPKVIDLGERYRALRQAAGPPEVARAAEEPHPSKAQARRAEAK